MGLDKVRRPVWRDSFQVVYTAKAAASTAFPTRGVFGVSSTSTDETPLVHTLVAPAQGDVLEVCVENLATSSSPIHINAGDAVFDCATQAGSTASADMITLSSAGAGFRLIASSSGRWLMTGNFGATLSTST